MADPTPNVELLEATYAFIEDNPKHWNQRMWRCKTGMCFAGWAVELAGGQWLVDMNQKFTGPTWDVAEDYLIPVAADSEQHRRTLYVDGESTEGTHVEDRAMRVLGIEHEDAEDLFNGSNDLADIRVVIDSIKERAADG